MVSLRGSRRYGSEALRANALHFGSDMAGSVAVLVGLIAAAQGHPRADAIAALFVAALVLLAAARLIRRNVDVLMDRSPAAAHDAAAAAIAGLDPPVELRRLRMRQAGGRHFADVVIRRSTRGAAVGQGHAAPTRWRRPSRRRSRGADARPREPRSDALKVSERCTTRRCRSVAYGRSTRRGRPAGRPRLEVSLHLSCRADVAAGRGARGGRRASRRRSARRSPRWTPRPHAPGAFTEAGPAELAVRKSSSGRAPRRARRARRRAAGGALPRDAGWARALPDASRSTRATLAESHERRAASEEPDPPPLAPTSRRCRPHGAC